MPPRRKKAAKNAAKSGKKGQSVKVEPEPTVRKRNTRSRTASLAHQMVFESPQEVTIKKTPKRKQTTESRGSGKKAKLEIQPPKEDKSVQRRKGRKKVEQTADESPEAKLTEKVSPYPKRTRMSSRTCTESPKAKTEFKSGERMMAQTTSEGSLVLEIQSEENKEQQLNKEDDTERRIYEELKSNVETAENPPKESGIVAGENAPVREPQYEKVESKKVAQENIQTEQSPEKGKNEGQQLNEDKTEMKIDYELKSNIEAVKEENQVKQSEKKAIFSEQSAPVRETHSEKSESREIAGEKRQTEQPSSEKELLSKDESKAVHSTESQQRKGVKQSTQEGVAESLKKENKAVQPTQSKPLEKHSTVQDQDETAKEAQSQQSLIAKSIAARLAEQQKVIKDTKTQSVKKDKSKVETTSTHQKVTSSQQKPGQQKKTNQGDKNSVQLSKPVQKKGQVSSEREKRKSAASEQPSKKIKIEEEESDSEGESKQFYNWTVLVKRGLSRSQLFRHFSAFGSVLEVKYLTETRTQRRENHALVLFRDPESMWKALEGTPHITSNQHASEHKKLIVKAYQPSYEILEKHILRKKKAAKRVAVGVSASTTSQMKETVSENEPPKTSSASSAVGGDGIEKIKQKKDSSDNQHPQGVLPRVGYNKFLLKTIAPEKEIPTGSLWDYFKSFGNLLCILNLKNTEEQKKYAHKVVTYKEAIQKAIPRLQTVCDVKVSLEPYVSEEELRGVLPEEGYTKFLLKKIDAEKELSKDSLWDHFTSYGSLSRIIHLTNTTEQTKFGHALVIYKGGIQKPIPRVQFMGGVVLSVEPYGPKAKSQDHRLQHITDHETQLQSRTILVSIDDWVTQPAHKEVFNYFSQFGNILEVKFLTETLFQRRHNQRLITFSEGDFETLLNQEHFVLAFKILVSLHEDPIELRELSPSVGNQKNATEATEAKVSTDSDKTIVVPSKDITRDPLAADAVKVPSTGKEEIKDHHPANVCTKNLSKPIIKCMFCKSTEHKTRKCDVVESLPLVERSRRLKRSNICLKCLGYGHKYKQCRYLWYECEYCQCAASHHKYLCPYAPEDVYIYTEATTTSEPIKTAPAVTEDVPKKTMEESKDSAELEDAKKSSSTKSETVSSSEASSLVRLSGNKMKTTASYLKDYFKKFGTIVSMDFSTYAFKGYQFFSTIEFDNSQAAEKLLKERPHYINGEALRIWKVTTKPLKAYEDMMNQSQTALIFDSLDSNISIDLLRQHFMNYGMLKYVTVIGFEESGSFVYKAGLIFKSITGVEKAIQGRPHAINGYLVMFRTSSLNNKSETTSKNEEVSVEETKAAEESSQSKGFSTQAANTWGNGDTLFTDKATSNQQQALTTMLYREQEGVGAVETSSVVGQLPQSYYHGSPAFQHSTGMAYSAPPQHSPAVASHVQTASSQITYPVPQQATCEISYSQFTASRISVQQPTISGAPVAPLVIAQPSQFGNSQIVQAPVVSQAPYPNVTSQVHFPQSVPYIQPVPSQASIVHHNSPSTLPPVTSQVGLPQTSQIVYEVRTGSRTTVAPFSTLQSQSTHALASSQSYDQVLANSERKSRWDCLEMNTTRHSTGYQEKESTNRSSSHAPKEDSSGKYSPSHPSSHDRSDRAGSRDRRSSRSKSRDRHSLQSRSRNHHSHRPISWVDKTVILAYEEAKLKGVVSLEDRAELISEMLLAALDAKKNVSDIQ